MNRLLTCFAGLSYHIFAGLSRRSESQGCSSDGSKPSTFDQSGGCQGQHHRLKDQPIGFRNSTPTRWTSPASCWRLTRAPGLGACQREPKRKK